MPQSENQPAAVTCAKTAVAAVTASALFGSDSPRADSHRQGRLRAVTVVEERLARPPTLEDARVAARAVAANVPGVVQVGVFGSVARGEATCDSDIDLLVVLEDLEYKNRVRIAGGDLYRVASRATDCPVGIVVTDVHEWAVRSQLATCFETSIADDLVMFYQSSKRVKVNREKPMDRPTSDLDEAYVRLGEAADAYEGAISAYVPNRYEQMVYQDNDTMMHEVYQFNRYRRLVVQMDLVLETSLKALHHALGDTPPYKTHRLAVLLDNLPDTPETRQVKAIVSNLRVDKLPPEAHGDTDVEEIYTNWRIHGSYDMRSVAADYLPASRVIAYMDAADRVTEVLLDVLTSRSPGGVLKSSPDATKHSVMFKNMRQIRELHDLATGNRIR